MTPAECKLGWNCAKVEKVLVHPPDLVILKLAQKLKMKDVKGLKYQLTLPTTQIGELPLMGSSNKFESFLSCFFFLIPNSSTYLG